MIKKVDGIISIIIIIFCGICYFIIYTADKSIVSNNYSVSTFCFYYKIQELIKSSIEITAWHIINNNSVINGKINKFIGDDEISISYNDLSSLIDINKAPEELLYGLFIRLGIENKASSSFAKLIISKRYDESNQINDNKSKNGNQSILNRAYTSPLELLFIGGIQSQIIIKALPWLTAENGSDKINISVADKTVLQSIPNMPIEMTNELINSRVYDKDKFEKILSRLSDKNQYIGSEKGIGIGIYILLNINHLITKKYYAVIIINDKTNEKLYRVISLNELL